MSADLSRYFSYYSTLAETLPTFSPEECRVIPWFRVDGDKTLRYTYPLKKDSIVYDMGGYEGEWAAKIHKLYGCTIEVFEPVEKFASILEKDFRLIKKIHVHSFGLAGSNRTEKINLDLASSSTFKKGSKYETIRLIKAKEFMANNKLPIDLIKINIEGGEYDLLDHLIKSGLIKNIKEIQLQFHVFVPNARKERLRIQRLLSKTHKMTFNYPFIWENWRLKNE